MNQSKKLWSWRGLFLALLVISIPIYSAESWALSVDVTKSSGQKGIEDFIDAEGDTWVVQATVSGLTGGTTITPEEMKIKIGSNSAPFQSCSGQEALGVNCQYSSALNDGVKPGSYNFEVVYTPAEAGASPSVSDSGVINADGTAPLIAFNGGDVSQVGEKIKINFVVDDNVPNQPCVGLQKIEIIDVDSNNVLQTVSDFKELTCSYDYTESDFAGVLQATLSGEGVKHLKIRAEDRLGHSASSEVVSFALDTVKPEIIENSLTLVDFGKFIGAYEAESDLQINITEKTGLEKVLASSEQGELKGAKGDCEESEKIAGLYTCTWKKVKFNPSTTIMINFVATDLAGNEAVKSVTKTFVRDNSAPQIEYFGTLRNFQAQSFVRSGENIFVLRVKEEGAGMSIQKVKADLGEVGGSSAQTPDECQQNEELGTFDCTWKFSKKFGTVDTVRVNLAQLEDNVGNDGELRQIELQVDDQPPTIKSMEVYGVADEKQNNFFQSKDLLRINLVVEEFSGLRILVDVRDLMMDAETIYPEGGDKEAGWMEFTEKDCEKKEAQWECQLETSPIKSGYKSLASFKVMVFDTSGNKVTKWEGQPKNVKSGKDGDYKIEILAVENEEAPDFWEVPKKNIKPLVPFVDLDTTTLTYARFPVTVKLSPSSDNVKSLGVKLGECVPYEKKVEKKSKKKAAEEEVGKEIVAPVLSRSLIYGGTSSESVGAPQPTLILEFEPFDGEKLFNLKKTGGEAFETKNVQFKCPLLISTQVGKKVVKIQEVQEVIITVPFGFSSLGAQDENLDELIQKEKEAASTGFWGTIGMIQKSLRVVDYGVRVVQMVNGGIILVADAKKSTTFFDELAPGSGVAACFGFNSLEENLDKGITFLNVPIQIASCRPTPDELGWYGKWQETILSLYNVEVLKSPNSPCKGSKGKTLEACKYKPGRDVKDNLYLSAASLCVPGIIKNLDKYRQIKCRKIYCLQNEVKAGLTTVSGCNELEGLLTCKYFVGELWYILPFSKFYDQVINALYQAIKDPIATAHTANIIACGAFCPTGGGVASSFCSYSTYIWRWVDYLEQIASFITTVYNDVKARGLQYCDSVL